MNAVVNVGFDYAALDQSDRDAVREAGVRIRLRMARTAQDIIEIGRDLIAVKERVGHGGFIRWIEAEFGMSDQSAANFMNVVRRFGGEIPNGLEFKPSVLYALAAPSTPQHVVEEVVERAESGERVTKDDVKALKEKYEAENADLKSKLNDYKLKEKDAKATSTDAMQQVEELRAELNKLRDERDTLKFKINQGIRPSDGKVAADPLDDMGVLEKQVARIMDAWNAAAPDARQEFLHRIDAPIMDRQFA